MRMFLVVMCDMFLLLYLTALAEVENRPMSELTVEDYNTLKQSSAKLSEQADERAALLSRREAELKEREEALRRLQDELRRAQEDKSRLNRSVQATQAKVGELTESEAKRRQAEEAAKAELERVQERQKEAETKLAALNAELSKKSEELNKAAAQSKAVAEEAAQEKAQAAALNEQLTTAKREQDEAKVRADELARKAQEAAAEAQKAKEEAEAEAKKAQEAESDKAEALERAKQARDRELAAAAAASAANALAQDAQSQAERSASAARDAAAQADQAKRERAKTNERLKSVTQRAQTAYNQNVEQRVETLKAKVSTDNLLIGSSETSVELAVVPVVYGQERVVFVPVDQVGLDEEDPSRYRKLSLLVGGRAVQRLYAKAGTGVVGLVLAGSGKGPAARPLSKTPFLTAYMPTLIAVRNKAAMNLSNRLRSLDEAHFVFQRDRLQLQADGILRYRQEGFRGTGDFGEQLLKGDQILDLDGNFLGIVIRDNLILPLPTLSGWTSVALDAEHPQDAVRRVFGVDRPRR